MSAHPRPSYGAPPPRASAASRATATTYTRPAARTGPLSAAGARSLGAGPADADAGLAAASATMLRRNLAAAGGSGRLVGSVRFGPPRTANSNSSSNTAPNTSAVSVANGGVIGVGMGPALPPATAATAAFAGTSSSSTTTTTSDRTISNGSAAAGTGGCIDGARLDATAWAQVRALWLRRVGLAPASSQSQAQAQQSHQHTHAHTHTHTHSRQKQQQQQRPAQQGVRGADAIAAAGFDLMCGICQSGYGPNEDQLLLSCAHVFHESCVVAYERAQTQRGAPPRCPVCRAAPYDALRLREGRRLWRFAAAVKIQRWARARALRRRFRRYYAAVNAAKREARAVARGASANRNGISGSGSSVKDGTDACGLVEAVRAREKRAFHAPLRCNAANSTQETRVKPDATQSLLVESDANVAAVQRLRQALDDALAKRVNTRK